MPRTIKKGESYVVYFPPLKCPKPTKAKVVALTTEPGRLVGVEFDEPMGGDDCNHLAKPKHGLWVRPEHIFTEDEWKIYCMTHQHEFEQPNYDEMVFGENGQVEYKSSSELQTITKGDIGELKL